MAYRKQLLVLAGCGAGLFLCALLPASAATPAGPDFQQVLTAPDDVQQNLVYARAQAAQGHLLPAAAALERILLADPNANGVRLFYVAVLIRLDDLQGAQQQLDVINREQLTPLQRAEAKNYVERIARGRGDVRIGGNIALGLAYDSDALGALHEELDFINAHPHKSGGSAIASGYLRIAKDFDPNGDLVGFASSSLYTRTSFSGPNADYINFDLKAGLEGSTLHSRWQVAAIARRYQIFNDPYLTEYGGHAEFSWRPDTSLTWMATAEIVGQNFHEPGFPSFLSGTHDGARFDFNAGPSYRLSASDTITAFLGYEFKTAGYKPFEYDAPYLFANYHSLLGDGAYFDALGEVRYVDYRYTDYYFLDARRQDWRTTGRVALGAPLSAFTPEGATGDYRENLIIEGAATYTSRNSDYPVSDFSGFGLEARLIWKFGETDH